MHPDAVRQLYNEDTARTYNERWHGPRWGNDTLHLAEAIARRVHPGIRWLDVGCGTGHFLSRFQDIERAGIDLSPSMLVEARAANPNALFFQEWDFRNDNPAWRNSFTLVTCTGEPWSYLQTIDETEQVVANLAAWTAPGGTCLLAAQDPLDLTGMRLPYEVGGEPGFPGEIYIKAVVWSMSDRSHEHIPEIGTKWHHNLVWPLLEHWIATFAQYFRSITIETLPHDPPWLNTPRRVLLATDKRVEGDELPVSVIHTTAGTSRNEMPAPRADGSTAPAAGTIEIARDKRWLSVAPGSLARLLVLANASDIVRAEIETTTMEKPWVVQFNQRARGVRENRSYVVEFRARADNGRKIFVACSQAKEPWNGLGLYRELELTVDWQSFREGFVARVDESEVRVNFDLGASDIAVELGDVVLREVESLDDFPPAEPRRKS